MMMMKNQKELKDIKERGLKTKNIGELLIKKVVLFYFEKIIKIYC